MRLAVVNQFYAPDISPTAQLAASLAEHRADRGDEVTVITGRAGYLEGLAQARAAREHPSLRVRRVWTPDLGKSTLARRLTGYATFLLGSVLRLLVGPRQDVIVAMTTPPLVVLGAVLHKLCHPSTKVVLWSMDCYPDAAERFGELRPGAWLSRLLRALNRRLFAHIDDVVALDGAMAELLAQYATAGREPRFHVVPNWERASLFPPVEPGGLPPWKGYDAMEVGERSIVVYLGNTGVGHRFDTVLDAAARLEDDAVFVFIGGGARWSDLVADARARGLTNVAFHGYVAKDETPAVMAGAAGALITLDDRSLGVMSPSKLHANLAAGLPIVYVGPEGSNVDEAIRACGCGYSLRHGDVDGVVAAVRGLRSATDLRGRARRAFEERYCDEATLPRFDAVLDA
ncbi:MAG TPA: glycosyltransferase family 4 protein [Acidimicrobiales bacterium]|nr:glycosyltransferase family 4 protein [Acidimicrobiales bacterium]